jgi:hypothetical protein
VNLRARLERLEKAVAQQSLAYQSPELGPAMSDAQLAETMERFLNGESLEAIAQSQGRPWHPPPPAAAPALLHVNDDDLREGIRLLLAEAEDTSEAETPDQYVEPQAENLGMEFYDTD